MLAQLNQIIEKAYKTGFTEAFTHEIIQDVANSILLPCS